MDEEIEIRKLEDEVFGAACDIYNSLPLDLLLEFLCGGIRERPRPAQVGGEDCFTDQIWL